MNTQPYLVAYDIRDPKRLGRVHRYLKRRALPVQYSVFVVRLAPEQIRRLLAGLGRIVAPTDDVRVYALGQSPRVETLGMQNQPGVMVPGAGPPGLD
jgi:CRISPR-associated protein Cas2